MSNEIEVITSVDFEGEWDRGQHVLNENAILRYGNGPNEHIVVKDLVKLLKAKKQNTPAALELIEKLLPSELAEFLHESYERQARKSNWETQKRCQVSFANLPFENKQTMLRVAIDLIDWLRNEADKLRGGEDGCEKTLQELAERQKRSGKIRI